MMRIDTLVALLRDGHVTPTGFITIARQMLGGDAFEERGTDCDRLPRLYTPDVPRETVLAMFRREQGMRYSATWQSVYRKARESRLPGGSVEGILQRLVLYEFGFAFDDESLLNYNRLPDRFREDQEVVDSIVYMRLNTMHGGQVKVGEAMVDVPLIEAQTMKETRLSELCEDGRKLLIMAFSIT